MKRRITMTVEITEHDNDEVSVRIFDQKGELISGRRCDTYHASLEIGAVAFEMAEEVT